MGDHPPMYDTLTTYLQHSNSRCQQGFDQSRRVENLRLHHSPLYRDSFSRLQISQNQSDVCDWQRKFYSQRKEDEVSGLHVNHALVGNEG